MPRNYNKLQCNNCNRVAMERQLLTCQIACSHHADQPDLGSNLYLLHFTMYSVSPYRPHRAIVARW